MAERVTVYGADWCGDTRRTLRHLDQSGVKYDYIDIDHDAKSEEKVVAFSKGKRRIPLVEMRCRETASSKCEIRSRAR